jgi:NACHT conflict system protein
MAILRTDITRALGELIENESGTEFQALAVVLAKQKWPELIATERHKDGGLDAYAPASLADGRKGKGVAASLTAKLKKVKGDAQTAKQNYADLEILLFVTPHKVFSPTATKWAEEVGKACGLGLHVMSREDIVTSLMLPQNAALCGWLPGITVPIEPDEADLLERVRAAVAEEAELWRRRQRMTNRPTISLDAVRLDGSGKETTDTMDIEALRVALGQARRITLEAPGGSGKTTMLVQIATEPSRGGEISFLVDLPAWIHSGRDPLEFIASGTPFRARNITPTNLAQLARHAQFSFLLNGWNEIAEIHSPQAITALDGLERNHPAAGIIVATRTHYVSPPLPGAIRTKLLGVTRRQRAGYLREVLGDRAEELRLHLVANPVLEKLTRTPLILAEVVTIFQSGEPVPSTRVGVLGAVTNLIESAPSHRPHLQIPPLQGHAERYLTHLAATMTERGEALVFAPEARAAVISVSSMLQAEKQLATPPDPDSILRVLTAHHVLEQIDHPSAGYRFQHQQFQEFYATRSLAHSLTTLAAKHDDAADRAFATAYINKRMWEEPLRMIAEELSLAVEEEQTRPTALVEGVRLTRMALRVDPALAADLARLAGPHLWSEVRDAFGTVLRQWYSIGDVHHRQLAMAAMTATASDDFADVILPLLTNTDREIRLSVYTAGEIFYPTSLGADWRNAVETWHEDARADFVSELVHRSLMIETGEHFALHDPSEKVRNVAIQELCWISATDAFERVINGLNDAYLEAALPAFFPEIVPEMARPRIIAANRRLIEREVTALNRIRLWLRGAEYGDTSVPSGLIGELRALSPPIDQNGAQAVESALKVVKEHDPGWVSTWLTTKLLDGSLTGEQWKPFLRRVPSEQSYELVDAMATRELSYREQAATRMILSMDATPELAQQIFDALCGLQRSMSSTGGQQDAYKYLDQLRGAFRDLPVETAVTGMMRSLNDDFDSDQLRVVTRILGRVNSDVEDLRGAMPTELRETLRRYLKDGIAKILAEDAFGDEIRSEAAISLGRIGDPEDLSDLGRLIDADIERINRKLNSTGYSNWFLLAIEYLDAPDADAKFIALLRNDDYMGFAARSLLQLAIPLRREKPFFGNTTDFTAIWKARDGMRPPGLDPSRAARYAEAIRGRIAELKQDMATSATPQPAGRIKDLAVILAALDGRNSANVVIEALSLSGQRDAHARVNGVRAMLMSGATMSLASMLAILDPGIEHALSQGLYRDQSLVLLVDCLELLPFSEDPAGGIARVEEVLDKFEHRAYQFRDVVTAMGYTRSEAAVPFLLKIARGTNGLQNIETPWLESLGRLNTDSSRRALLSFIDPDIPLVGVNLAFDHHNVEIYAAFVGAWARDDFMLKQKLLAMSAGKLTATQHRLLPAIYAELGDSDTMVAGANLLSGGLSPLLGRGRLERQFLERKPGGPGGWFTFVPQNAEKARAELFQAVLHDADRRKSAFAILGQVEVWRMEYGRPLGESRHPMIDSGEPWPPLRFFPQS